MSTSTPPLSFSRPVVSGKFFRAGDAKFYPKGVTYGPLCPAPGNEPFATPEQTARDFDLIRQLGANLLRIYHVPAPWFLDLAAASQLRLLIDIPWNKHLCFLDSPASRGQARRAVRSAVADGAGHPAVFAYCIVNELPPDIVRWSGARAVEDFLDELIDEAKNTDPDCLCTFANYPPTEFLHPPGIDFLSFNVFLHQQRPFENYLARLQMMAGSKPLLLGETGLDPSNLELEVTESVLMKHAQFAAAILQILRNRGVRVSVDDFGTGYSSLSYLQQFPLDALKIDQSFVRGINTNPGETTIVNAIINMGRSLNMRVIAEGVETAGDLAFLKAHNCDEAQGYYFSRPVPAEQFARFLERHNPQSFKGITGRAFEGWTSPSTAVANLLTSRFSHRAGLNG